jgi:serine/threonine-protein kinase
LPPSVRAKPVSFGKYTLLERIAVGGMAEVFLAMQAGVEGFEKWLAIKRIRPHLSNEEAFIKMFLNEAKLAAQLQHPNIVQIYDLGHVQDSYFIAMEYISGRDMSRVIPKAEKMGIPFPLEYALAIAASVLDGLAYAHPRADAYGVPLNIVHRDVTPENIMVGWNGNVKILDFGIAKAATQSDQTRAGEIKGKLSYMSPEQAMGKSLDARSDLFALGIVLYEWVTGYRLFTGENEMAILKSIIDGKIYPPSYFREDVPERIEEILMRALMKNRDERYQSARDMQLDILQWFTEVGFTPTSLHLANFLKQIFGDEIAAEQKALASAAASARRAANSTPPPAPALTPGSGRAQVGEAVGVAKTPADGKVGGNGQAPALIVVEAASQLPAGRTPVAEGRLTISLGVTEYERLKAAAQRNGVAVEQVVQDILRSTLKYL